MSVITNNKQRRLIPAIQERAKMKSKNEIPVVVCTEKRGVFFGYLPAGAKRVEKDGTLVRSTELVRARMCQYWSAATKGVLGLASIGPQPGSKIGPPVPRITMRDPTCFVDVTPEAAAAWESAPWA